MESLGSECLYLYVLELLSKENYDKTPSMQHV